LFCNNSDYDCYDRVFQTGEAKNVKLVSGLEGLEKDHSGDYQFHLHKGEERFIVYEATDPDFDVGISADGDYTIERKYHPLTPLQLFLTSRDEQLFNILEDSSNEVS